jgi:hypothetical protein
LPEGLFLPGLNGYVLAEFYETMLFRIASHGFFVFGLDYKFPMEQVKNRHNIRNMGNNLKEDINKFFQQYTWVCCVDLFLVNIRKNYLGDAYIIWMMTFYQSIQLICFRDYYAMYAKHCILSDINKK